GLGRPGRPGGRDPNLRRRAPARDGRRDPAAAARLMAVPVRASLMITCLGDMFFPELGVRIQTLERFRREFERVGGDFHRDLGGSDPLTRGVNGPKEGDAMLDGTPRR